MTTAAASPTPDAPASASPAPSSPAPTTATTMKIILDAGKLELAFCSLEYLDEHRAYEAGRRAIAAAIQFDALPMRTLSDEEAEAVAERLIQLAHRGDEDALRAMAGRLDSIEV